MEQVATINEQREYLNGRETGLPFTSNALKILGKRYLQQGDDGPVETPEDMYHRVADSLASVDLEYGATAEEVRRLSTTWYDILTKFEFTPAGRTLTNAGAKTPVVSNCIVLHFDDSMDGIFQTLKDAAQLQQLGSGLGFAWHLLRPAGWKAKRSGGVASGPVSFLKVFDQAFGVIKQQGRHGANMGVMSVSHPDILEFIHCKELEGSIRNFNISVGLTEEFMSAVDRNDPSPWLCEWKGIKMKPRRIKRDAYDNILEINDASMSAKEVFDEIMNCAWINGEPGCVFLDNINKTNPLPGLGPIHTCNPCGEQFLHDGDVCNLGSINLSKFVNDGQIDWSRLEFVTQHSIRMLDNVIDSTTYPVQKVKDAMLNNRRIGLGIMGWGDMLYQLKIPYNSERALELAEQVMGRIQYVAERASEYLAIEKGNFPNIDKSIFKGKQRRNAALTCVAPTGSIAMLFDCTSGIEPTFALSYFKGRVMGDNVLYYANRHFEEEMERRKLLDPGTMEMIAISGSIQNIIGIPDDLKKVFVVAHDISPEWHMRMQAAFQKHVDNAISKTVNFPHDATKDDIEKAYVTAWKLGCKGMTVYRDGSREIEVLSVKNPKKKDSLKNSTVNNTAEKCQCGATMRVEEGCANCPECGNALCKL